MQEQRTSLTGNQSLPEFHMELFLDALPEIVHTRDELYSILKSLIIEAACYEIINKSETQRFFEVLEELKHA